MSYSSGKLKSGIKGVSRFEDIIFLRQYQGRCERVSITIFYNHGDNKSKNFPPRFMAHLDAFPIFFFFVTFFFFLLSNLFKAIAHDEWQPHTSAHGTYTHTHTHIHTYTHPHTWLFDTSKLSFPQNIPVSNLLYVISLIFFFSYTHLSVQSKSL